MADPTNFAAGLSLKKIAYSFCLCACFLVAAITGAQVGSASRNVIAVQPSSAEAHLARRVDPEYPQMARAARLQGSVVLRVTISPQGNVASIDAISGNPLFINAAVIAVREWHYRPFHHQGHPVAAQTIVRVPFSVGIPKTSYEEQERAAEAYFKTEDDCRKLVNTMQFAVAEPVCKHGIKLAEKLPPNRLMERATAYQQAGHAAFYRRNFSEALTLYQRELEISKTVTKPYEAELGYAYHHVALGLHATGSLIEARSFYELSESTLEQARAHIVSELLKNRYSAAIKSVLADYAVLLRQMGDESGAQAADEKRNSIILKSDLKDN